MEIASIHWTMTLQGERLSPRERLSALRTGFIASQTIHQQYQIKDDILRGKGPKSSTDFPAEHRDLWLEFASVRDKDSLLTFVERHGLLGCGRERREVREGKELGGAAERVTCISPPEGDDVEHALRHVRTVNAIRRLIGVLHTVRSDGVPHLAAELADVYGKTDLALGPDPEQYGSLPRLPGGTRQVAEKPVSEANYAIRFLINVNMESVRPVVCAFAAGRSRPFLTSDRLIDFIYWQLAQELSDDRTRRCKRADCPKVFQAKRRDQVYCSRRCLDRDKSRRRYAEERARRRRTKRRR